MRLTLVAVGKMKAGPGRELVARYQKRAEDSGRALGFSGPLIVEIPESRAGRADDRRSQEAAAIRKAIDDGSFLCFDERGDAPDSETIARWLAARRDSGLKTLALVIGGADGLAPELRRDAASVWSFGAATFPHQIARILAVEQLYRAMTILGGHPYHRGE